MKENRDGNWIQTYTGKRYFVLDPRPEDVDIKDIAHALSLKCRYGGHCVRFYSVAEHSVRCAQYLKNKLSFTPIKDKNLFAWALMHDSAEYVTADVARPIKKSIPVFGEIEEKNLKVIAEAFDLPYPMDEETEKLVKEADDVMLMTERRDNMNYCEHPWTLDGMGLEDGMVIVPQTCEDAERRFLEVFHMIFGPYPYKKPEPLQLDYNKQVTKTREEQEWAQYVEKPEAPKVHSKGEAEIGKNRK